MTDLIMDTAISIPTIKVTMDDFEKAYPEAINTFGHIVLADYNLSDGHIHWCLEANQIYDWRLCALESIDWTMDRYSIYVDIHQMIELENATIRFLQWLLTVPEKTRVHIGDEEYEYGVSE